MRNRSGGQLVRRIGLLLAVVTAALSALAGLASGRPADDAARWQADPADASGSTLVLRIAASSPFIHVFLYPDANVTFSAIDQATCRSIVAPRGQGLGCNPGATSSFTVGFKTTPALPAGTTAKLVLDNADGPGARALTVTLTSCAEEARAFADAQARFRAAYQAMQRVQALNRALGADIKAFQRYLDWLDRQIRAGKLPNSGNDYEVPRLAQNLARNAALYVKLSDRAMDALQKAFEEMKAARDALDACTNRASSIQKDVLHADSTAACPIDSLSRKVHAFKFPAIPAALRAIAREAARGHKAVALSRLGALRTTVAKTARQTSSALTGLSDCAP